MITPLTPDEFGPSITLQHGLDRSTLNCDAVSACACITDEDPPVQADRVPVPMMGNPLPAGHAAQARVAPLPDARG